jgi:uncharacterized OsmC-like protein
MTSTVIYEGGLRTVAKHIQSGSLFETDAPTDNQGKGARFSPTDLIGTALASCMLTTIPIRAPHLEQKIQGVWVDVVKVMVGQPRRIGALHLTFHYPVGFHATPGEYDEIEQIAMTCPVKESIHPGIELRVDFNRPS